MRKRILIIGASGAGTTTVGKKLANRLGNVHIESDDLFWFPTNPPYTKFRNQAEINSLLNEKVIPCGNWVLSGSPCGWGDSLIELFDLAVFLIVPTQIRLERIREREPQRFGSEVMQGGTMYESHQNFLAWTARYDLGGINGRTKELHESWLKLLRCPVIRFEGDISADKIVEGIVVA